MPDTMKFNVAGIVISLCAAAAIFGCTIRDYFLTDYAPNTERTKVTIDETAPDRGVTIRTRSLESSFGEGKIRGQFFGDKNGTGADSEEAALIGEGASKNDEPTRQKKRSLQHDRCAAFDTSIAYRLFFRHSDKVLVVAGGGMDSGASLVQMTPVADNNDQSASKSDAWRLESVPGGYYQVINESSGLAMSVVGESLDNGADVIQVPATSDSTAVNWCFEDISNTGYFVMLNENSGQAVDIGYASVDDGANAIQWPRSKKLNQQVFLDPMTTDEGTSGSDPKCVVRDISVHYRIVARHSGLALTVAQHEALSLGASVVQERIDEESATDTWELEPSGTGGHYHLINVRSGLAMTVASDSLKRGRKVVQDKVSRSASQIWCFQESDDDGYYRVVVQHSGQALDIAKASMEAGTRANQWPVNRNSNQQFQLLPASSDVISTTTTTTTTTTASKNPATTPSAPVSPEECAVFPTGIFYHITNILTNEALRTSGNGWGTPIIQRPITSEADDNWELQEAGNDGYYHVVNEKTGLVLHVDDTSDVVQWGFSGTELRDNWCFRPVKEGWYTIVAEHSGQAIEVKSGASAGGETGFIQSPVTGVESQMFRLTVVSDESAGGGGGNRACAALPLQPNLMVRYNLVARHSGKALGITYSSHGASIGQTPVEAGIKWRFESAGGSSGHYRIVDESSGRALSVATLPSRTGYYRIVNEQSGLAMSVEDASDRNGADIVQEAVVAGAATNHQNWCFENVDGTHYAIVAQHSGKVIDIERETVTSGANALQWSLGRGKTHQQFKLIPPPGEMGTSGRCALLDTDTLPFQLSARHSGLVLVVPGDSVLAGESVVQARASEVTTSNRWRLEAADGEEAVLRLLDPPVGAASNWCFQDVGDGYYEIVNQRNGRAITVQGASNANGADVILDVPSGLHNQHFLLVEARMPPGGVNPSPSRLWEGPFLLPLVPAAGANLPDGRMLLWSSYGLFHFDGGPGKSKLTWTTIFDPSTGKSTSAALIDTNHDMFCPGTAVLPDGRILITGGNADGTSPARSTIYDPQKNEWSSTTDMNIGRGYHSMTVLEDGSVFVLGGSWSGGKDGKKDGEVWNYATETWSERPGVPGDAMSTSDRRGPYRADNHMWLFTAPNGNVFHAGPSKQMNWINPRRDGGFRRSVLRSDDMDAMNGNAVMFDIGKILTLGGSPYYDDGAASQRAYVIDVTDPGGVAKVARTAGDMAYPRSLCQSIVLPTGQVVVVGGMTVTDIFSDDNAVLAAELWSPETGKFETLASMSVPRTYHSLALLAKDGRVVVTGGGLCGKCSVNHPDVEIFAPPYLLNNKGELLKDEGRPEIRSVSPESLTAGETFMVTMGGPETHTFALCRLSAATHSIDNDKRRIPLRAQVAGRGFDEDGEYVVFSLKVPDKRAVALPGTYFLFSMNERGVPSIAKVVSILVS